MLRIAVLGASGYTGGELIRLLHLHPGVEITEITSEQSAGKPVDAVFPHLRNLKKNLTFKKLDIDNITTNADFIFSALPHHTSIEPVAQFISRKKKVVDLSADYRIKDPLVYEKWYQHEHNQKGLLKSAVYGLPEVHRDEIKNASLVANPGCYPTSVLLGITPLLKEGMIDTGEIIIDAKSGISGAGRSPALTYHFPEANEGFEAYKIGNHRHVPEMEQEIEGLAGEGIKILFTPHLIPVNRGILSTIYIKQNRTIDLDLVTKLYLAYYKDEPFVRLTSKGIVPNIRDVRGSNYCNIGIFADSRTGYIIIVSCIDNLVKGASGQAVQNMNIMMGFDETTGLNNLGLFP